MIDFPDMSPRQPLPPEGATRFGCVLLLLVPIGLLMLVALVLA